MRHHRRFQPSRNTNNFRSCKPNLLNRPTSASTTPTTSPAKQVAAHLRADLTVAKTPTAIFIIAHATKEAGDHLSGLEAPLQHTGATAAKG
jgi:hypothetical protein